jgi:hypothetical protein
LALRCDHDFENAVRDSGVKAVILDYGEVFVPPVEENRSAEWQVFLHWHFSARNFYEQNRPPTIGDLTPEQYWFLLRTNQAFVLMRHRSAAAGLGCNRWEI